jgi:hypothetical protein
MVAGVCALAMCSGCSGADDPAGSLQGGAPSHQAPNGGKADNPNAPSTITCSYDTPTELPRTSETMAEYIVSGTIVSADNVGSLSEVESNQLVAAVKHLGFIDGDEGMEAVLAASDDKTFELLEFEYEVGSTFIPGEWVRFYAGDNEVGVLFADGTATAIAEVSDGDIMGCK